MSKLQKVVAVMLIAIMGMAASVVVAGEGGYAKVYADGATCSLGSTGIGAKIIATANYFVVTKVDTGSPSHGLVLEDDVITGIDGKPLSGKDIRVAFGYAILDAEASDGLLKLNLLRGGNPIEVEIRLPRTPDFSATWPFDCERSRIMLDRACAYLAREQQPNGQVPSGDGLIGDTTAGLLFLSTGDPEYLDNARRAAYWFNDWLWERYNGDGGYGFGSWTVGFGGLTLAEYYALTGDRNILPGLELSAKLVAEGQANSGSWSHAFGGGGYGEVNLAGMACQMTILLAKECGLPVNEELLAKAMRFSNRYAPSLSSAYGDMFPAKSGYNAQNGKVGALAVVHRLNSHSDYSEGYALRAARSMDTVLTGHTGHFFNMMWTPVAASLAPAEEYRRAMDQIGWYYALSQTWRGGLFCQEGGSGSGANKYSNGGTVMTTAGIGLSLAVPHRMLRILGAPVSPFAQTLPPELADARKLHDANKWDEAIAVVDTYLQKDGLSDADKQLAYALRDRIRYVKTGNELAIAKVSNMLSAHRLNIPVVKVEGMINGLKRAIGADNPQLVALEAKLPGRDRKLWERADQYHAAMKHLTEISKEVWFYHSSVVRRSFPDLAAPFDLPVWTSIAGMTPRPKMAKNKEKEKEEVKEPPTPGNWRILELPITSELPKNWASCSFDDKNWLTPEAYDPGRMDVWFGKLDTSNPQKRQLIRMHFDLKDPSVKQLRLTLERTAGSFLLAGSKIYLNDELVLECLQNIDSGSVELLRAAPSLLRKGPNVLAISTPTVNGYPRMVLEAELPSGPSTFRWTEVPGRDAEICKLTAKRTGLRPYFNAQDDNRTMEELMAVFQAKPTFMPEIDYALSRYETIAPTVENPEQVIKTLLTSPVWGARYAGVLMINHAMTGDWPAEQRAAARTMGEGFMNEVIEKLNDPQSYIRFKTAELLSQCGAKAVAAKPRLIEMVADFKNESWWTRNSALKALRNMPLDVENVTALNRVAYTDPDTGPRSSILDGSFLSGDEAVAQEAVDTYPDQLIDQIFTIPLSMFTRGKRAKSANAAIKYMPKETLRSYLPRIIKGLQEDLAAETISGCQAIIASFGEEYAGELKALLKDDSERVHDNALKALQMIAIRDDASAALRAYVRDRLAVIASQEDSNRKRGARTLLEDLEKKMKTTLL